MELSIVAIVLIVFAVVFFTVGQVGRTESQQPSQQPFLDVDTTGIIPILPGTNSFLPVEPSNNIENNPYHQKHIKQITRYVNTMKKYADRYLNDEITKEELEKRLSDINHSIWQESAQYHVDTGHQIDSKYLEQINKEVLGVEGFSDAAEATRWYVKTKIYASWRTSNPIDGSKLV